MFHSPVLPAFTVLIFPSQLLVSI